MPQGKKFLVIGNGASARTVFHSLKERGAAAVQIIARNTKSADEAKLGEYRKFSDFEFVVNATPYGNYPENALEPLFPLQDFRNLEGAIDLNYNPALTPLLREAKSCGAKTADGLYMLVAQAARNLARFGFSPEISISEVYREMRLHRANIVLIGMPHSGKSTLGKALSEVLEGRNLWTSTKDSRPGAGIWEASIRMWKHSEGGSGGNDPTCQGLESGNRLRRGHRPQSGSHRPPPRERRARLSGCFPGRIARKA